jgi:tripartite-type tricarboxylate transporter receptor subunit TctC
MVRGMLASGEFIEIHIDTALAEAERRDVKGLYTKARAGQLTFSSSGNGSGAHLAGGMLDSMAKVKTAHIPYKGGALAMTDLVAGQLQFSFLTYTSSSAFIKSHRLKALAVTTAQRSKALPDLPSGSFFCAT